MTVENQNSVNLQLPESNKVIVVGAGPVGLVASLLLSKYHVTHVLVGRVHVDAHDRLHQLRAGLGH